MNFSKKIWHILLPRQRRNIVILLGMMVISMALETFGISLVIPTMILITKNDLLDKYPFIKPWLYMLGNPSYESLIIIGMSILIGMYVVKTCFLVLLAWSQGKFLFDVQVGLSQRLYAGYLRQPYVFHIQRNSAQLIRNVVTETELFTFKAILPGMTVMTELLVVLGITALLLYVEPFGAILVAVILGVAGIIFHTVTKQPLLRWGQARQLNDALRLQHLQQGLGGVKEIKLFGREQEFLAQYNVHNIRRVLMSRWENLLQTFPRIYLELLAVTSLAGLILIMIVQHKPVASFMPALGLFAAAAFRLLPAANRMLGAIQNLRYSLPIISTLHSEIIQLEKPIISFKNPARIFSHQLVLNNVSYRYPSASIDTIEHVNLTINKGTSIGLVGESGAGKSTLIDLILGLLTPSKGQIEIDGVDIQFNIRAWQDQIGYVSQTIYLSDDTIRRNIAFGLAAEQIDEGRVLRAVKSAQLETFISNLPNGLNTLVGERGVRLSGGQRQRIGIARALYHNPSILVLDEATSSLDIGTEEEVMQEVHELRGERTLIIIAHRLSAVKRCDKLIHFDRGKVVKENQSSLILQA